MIIVGGVVGCLNFVIPTVVLIWSECWFRQGAAGVVNLAYTTALIQLENSWLAVSF